jgi:hypothetical protein
MKGKDKMKEFNEMPKTQQWLISTIAGSSFKDNSEALKSLDSLSPEDIRITVLGMDVTEFAIEELSESIRENFRSQYKQGYEVGKENFKSDLINKVIAFISQEG